jgi:electron transport complex protein RnfD
MGNFGKYRRKRRERLQKEAKNRATTDLLGFEDDNGLVVEPAPHVTFFMTKDRLMQYVSVALLILVGVSFFSWGLTSLVTATIAVIVAVALDFLLALVLKEKGPVNTMSAVVYGLIVALSYSLGVPSMAEFSDVMPKEALAAPQAYMYVAVISAFGMIVFKKGQGLLGRKYVNPAAAAKLTVLLPFITRLLLVPEHFASIEKGGLGVPSLAGPIGFTVINNNGAYSFASYLQACFANPADKVIPDVYWLMLVQKFHGWAGGASSIAVIVVGIGLFIAARGYIKWRITLSYLSTVSLMALFMTAIYGGDLMLRVAFEVLIGSSIFLAFFMATDPATTPLTFTGQFIFGAGLGILTVLIQTFMNFYGGSILALILMNLSVPLLDNVGIRKPFGRR